MTKVSHTPLRRCLGCRGSRRKDELIRLVHVGRRGVVIDVGQMTPGRGAYLCNDDGCLRIGLNARTLSNAFRRRVAIDGRLRKSIFQGDWEESGCIRESLAPIGGGE